MKFSLLSPLILILVFMLGTTACRTNQVARVHQPGAKKMPPGQAKKIYGHQSAKAFAPGQQKKGNTVVYSNGKVLSKEHSEGKGKPGKKGKGKKK